MKRQSEEIELPVDVFTLMEAILNAQEKPSPQMRVTKNVNICDVCDEEKECAALISACHYTYICEDCLRELLKAF